MAIIKLQLSAHLLFGSVRVHFSGALAFRQCALCFTVMVLLSEDFVALASPCASFVPAALQEKSWRVRLVCTGSLPLQERSILVVGSTLGGWVPSFPVGYSDQLVIMILMPKSGKIQHYSICNCPYITGQSATWRADVDLDAIATYVEVLKDLQTCCTACKTLSFLGISAGVLSTMALANATISDDTLALKPRQVFLVAGAWHPKVHTAFLDSIARSRLQVLVLNHEHDCYCAWSDQRMFWCSIKSCDVHIALHIDTDPFVYDSHYHDMHYYLLSQEAFWQACCGDSPGMEILAEKCTSIGEYSFELNQSIFSQFAQLWGPMLICSIWKSMWKPDFTSMQWHSTLDEWMQRYGVENTLFRDNYVVPLSLQQSVQHLILDSVHEGLQLPVVECKLYGLEVQVVTMPLVSGVHCLWINLSDSWVSTKWLQDGDLLDSEQKVFEYMSFVILQCKCGTSLKGFFIQRKLARAGKKRWDGTRARYPQKLHDLCLMSDESCTEDAYEVMHIRVIRCSSMLGVGRWGQVYFDNKGLLEWWTSSPLNNQHNGLLQEQTTTLALQSMHQVALSTTGGISTVQRKCAEILHISMLCPVVNVAGPPGTGKTTHIEGILRVMCSKSGLQSQDGNLRVLLLGPTNHNVLTLARVVDTVLQQEDHNDVSAWLLQSETAAGKRGNLAKDFVHVQTATLHGERAIPFCGSLSRKGNRIVCCTSGMLQKPIHPWNDCLASFQGAFDYILIDEGGQIVDVQCFAHQTLLRARGRTLVFGDAKQLSCYSSLRLRRRSALDAIPRRQVILQTTYRLQSLVGEITAQTMYVDEQLLVASKSNYCNFVFVEVENQLGLPDDCVRSSVRSAAVEVGIVRALSEGLSTLGEEMSGASQMHYVTFYGAQKRLFRRMLGNAPQLLKDCLTVDSSQGLDTDIEILSVGRQYGIGFLSDIRRYNVAFTRAKKLLVLVIHHNVVETWHPVWQVFRGLRHIAKYCNAYVFAGNAMEVNTLSQEVLTRVRQPSFGNASNVVAGALRQRCHWGTVLDNFMSYKRDNLALQHSSVLEDVTEIENQEPPEDVPDELSDPGDPDDNCHAQKSYKTDMTLASNTVPSNGSSHLPGGIERASGSNEALEKTASNSRALDAHIASDARDAHLLSGSVEVEMTAGKTLSTSSGEKSSDLSRDARLLSGSVEVEMTAGKTLPTYSGVESSDVSVWSLMSFKNVNVLGVKYGLDLKPWQDEASLLTDYANALAVYFNMTTSQKEWLHNHKGKLWFISYLNLKRSSSSETTQIKDVVNRKSILIGQFPALFFSVERFRNLCENVDNESFECEVVSEAEAVQHTYSNCCHSDFNWSKKFLQGNLYYDISTGTAVKRCTQEQILGMLERERNHGKVRAAMNALRESLLHWRGSV